MIKAVIRKSIAISSVVALLASTLCVSANEITDYEVIDKRYISVEGELTETAPGILVNLWAYKDGKLIAVKQGETIDGKYSFQIDLGRVLSGDYMVKTVAQIEEADSETFEYFDFSGEIGAVYEDIFENKGNKTYLTEKFNGDYKRYMTASNPLFAPLINEGKTSDVIEYLMKELEGQTAFVQEELVKSLNYVAAVKTIENATSSDIVVAYFLNQDSEIQAGNRDLLKIGQNAVLARFEENIKNDIPEESSSDEEFDVYEERIRGFAENLISSKPHFLEHDDFIDEIEECFLITDINRCRGKDALIKIIQDYADDTNAFDLTKFNNTDNDKDEVLKKILLKVEKGEIKTVSQIQEMLDTNIKKPSENGNSNNGVGSLGGSSGGSSGGKGSTTASAGISFPTTNFDENAVVKPEVIDFKDMSGYAWAEESVDALVKMGMLNGYSNERFAPEENVTRAQFAKMMCNVFGIAAATDGMTFVDVPSDAWFAGCVNALHNDGYINGIGNNYFGADETISRQDAFTIIFRILKDRNFIQEEHIDAEFNDWDYVSDYAQVPLATLSAIGLIEGDKGNVLPSEKMTRAEGAVIMYRVYAEVYE